jgi:hypothetical protein
MQKLLCILAYILYVILLQRTSKKYSQIKRMTIASFFLFLFFFLEIFTQTFSSIVVGMVYQFGIQVLDFRKCLNSIPSKLNRMDSLRTKKKEININQCRRRFMDFYIVYSIRQLFFFLQTKFSVSQILEVGR